MRDVISAVNSLSSPVNSEVHRPSPLCAQRRMGCSTSSQTSATESNQPGDKPDESNGASTTGAANENGKVAEDSETIPDQTPAEGGDAKPADEPAADAAAAASAASADNTAAAPPAAAEAQPAADSPPAEAAAPAEASAAADGGAEPAAAAPEQEKAEATSTDAEPKTEEAPAPSE
ncbi:cytochrome c1-like [Acanthopagrus latus]|uniref:cytochrome c1-like n=1 Tax=Acanthopagrus latus TaxID=8177 RepID=UPI00187C96CF|nr:cytochrome c1-like [Acanthopagrus latus]